MATKKTSNAGEWGHDPDYFKTAKRPGALEGLKVGDRVIWTKYHLKAIGCGPTNDLWRAVGEVVEIVDDGAFKGWPRVKWEDEEDPRLVNPANLARKGVPSPRACE